MIKPQYSGHLVQRSDSLEKTLMLGKVEGKRKRGRQLDGIQHWLDGITDSMDFEQTPGYSERQRSLACGSSWGWKELDTT